MIKFSKFFKIIPLFFSLFSILLLTTPTFAQDDIVWSTPQKINISENHALLPTIVTGPNGYLHAAWMELTPGDDFWTGTQTPGIFYSFWNGDTWSNPYKVSENTGWTGFPAIAITSDYNVHIFWEDDSENDQQAYGRILYRFYNGSSWSSPISIAPSLDLPGAWSWNPQVVRDSLDNLHVLLNYTPPNDDSAQVYYVKGRGSSWSTPIRLALKEKRENIQHYSIAVDSNNNPHVALWELGEGSADSVRGIHYLYFNGTSWQPSSQLTPPGGNEAYPKIIIDKQNNIHIIWILEWCDSNYLKNKVYYVKKAAGGETWSLPILITEMATHSTWLLPITGLTFDSSNNIYVGWGERVGWGEEPEKDMSKGIRVSYKRWNSATQSWESPVFMRYAYDLDTPFLYKDIWDNQHLTWSEENENTHVWEFWYSAVPVNIQTYKPGQSFSMTVKITNDTLSIPAGALASPTNISVQVGPLPASANQNYTTLPRSFTYRPHGTTFAAGKSAQAVIKYTDAEMIGADERNMKLYIWDSLASSWSTSFTTSVNTGKNQATVTLPHFSLFGVMIPRVQTDWLEPLSKEKTYQLGSTIPLKFKLGYADNSPFDPGQDVKLVILNSKNEKVKTFSMGKNTQSLRYLNNQFLATFQTKGLTEGDYKAQVTLADNPVGEITLVLTSKP